MAEANENHRYKYDFCIFYKKDEKEDRDVVKDEKEDRDVAKDKKQDRAVAIDILEYLEQNGGTQLKGYIEERDAILGATHISNMDNVITNSRFVFVILSQKALKCNWFEYKLHASLTHRLDSDLRNTVIPIYTGHVQPVPPSLTTINGIDYDADKESGFWKRLQQLFKK